MADNYDFIYTHVSNLRKKLSQAGCKDYIRAVYGMGCHLELATIKLPNVLDLRLLLAQTMKTSMPPDETVRLPERLAFTQPP